MLSLLVSILTILAPKLPIMNNIYKTSINFSVLGNQNIEYQGTSAGGTIELSGKKKIKSASKIADELYSRFNEEDRSLKDKQYIKNLLDWY